MHQERCLSLLTSSALNMPISAVDLIVYLNTSIQPYPMIEILPFAVVPGLLSRIMLDTVDVCTTRLHTGRGAF